MSASATQGGHNKVPFTKWANEQLNSNNCYKDIRLSDLVLEHATKSRNGHITVD